MNTVHLISQLTDNLIIACGVSQAEQLKVKDSELKFGAMSVAIRVELN